MVTKKISHQHLVIALIIMLSACGPVTPAPTSTPIPPTNTMTPLPTITPLPTFTPFMFIFPTPQNLPTNTIEPTQTPWPAVLKKFPLDGYILLFVKDGDLYFQDGNNSPIKVTHVGEAHYSYMLSDDHQKVLLSDPFSYAYGGVGYSINTDGTQIKAIFPGGWPDKNLLWGTRLGNVEFVPGTHQLILNTQLCNSYDNPTSCVSSLFLTDADTDISEVKKLAELGFTGGPRNKTFKVSPNGKMVAITTTTHVEIIDMEGKVIRYDILPFKPNTYSIIFPSVFWLPNSSGLIIAIPNTLFDDPAFNFVPAYTIWRYKIDSNSPVQIPLDPPPMAFRENVIQVSPDGKWIVYGAIGGGTEVYVADLENGNVEIFGKAVQASFSWSPDSKRFTVSGGGSAIGSIDTPVLRYPSNCLGWIDGNHLLCPITQENVNKLGLGVAEIVSGGLKYYDLGIDKDVRIILIKPK